MFTHSVTTIHYITNSANIANSVHYTMSYDEAIDYAEWMTSTQRGTASTIVAIPS